MPKRLRPAYVVEHKDGSKEIFRTKREICEKYGMKLGYVNKALISYPFKSKESPVRIRFFYCNKDCPKYMLENCDCGWYKRQVRTLRRKKNESVDC